MSVSLTRSTRWASHVVLLGLALGLTACVSVKVPAPSATPDNVQKLRATSMAPAQVGRFVLAQGLPAAKDQSQGGLRGSSVEAEGGSFARYLGQTLKTDLQAAGLLDESSKLVIEGELLESELDAAIGTGTGSLGARFVVIKAGQKVFDKKLRVDDRWESSFMGAVALPLAINKYTEFYKRLVGKLIDDLEFRAALAR